MMNEENNNRRTRLLEDLDMVRQRISELEESEMMHSKAEQDLKETIDRYRYTVDTIPLGVFSVDIQGQINYVNSPLLKRWGLDSNGEAYQIEMTKHPLFIESGEAAEIQRCIETQKEIVFEHVLSQQNGEPVWLRDYLSPIFSKDGSISGALAIVMDISEQKKAEAQLTQKLDLEKNIHSILSHIIKVTDVDEAINSILERLGKISKTNRAFLFRFSEDKTKMDNTHERCASGVKPQINNLQNISVANFTWWMEKLYKGETVQVKDTSTSSEETKAENEFMANAEVKSYLILPVMRDAKLFGFVGYASAKKEKTWSKDDVVLLQTVSGVLGDFLERKHIEDVKKERDKRFHRLAMASLEALFLLEKGKIVDSNHAAGILLGFKPSEYQGKELLAFVEEKEKEKVQKFFRSDSGVPLESIVIKKDGAAIPVEIQSRNFLYQDEPLKAITLRDVSERKQAKTGEREELIKVKKTLVGSVKALSSVVTLRDPYTVGHEQGVARLAGMISQELGLPEDRVEGIRVAALVHDIGKISIPAEILSKPGPLTEEERMMINRHPQTAYDILKDVKFPWAVAKIVLQHHERMDGSGYPNGISGKDILLEARIMALADTVEASMSDRSYRPAKGLEIVIEEISLGKGSLFDPKIADAVLKIVSTEGFSLR
jgi:PAS domain S-box-containing protein/putative nucleotidyltransferase with HDIG domain